MPLQATSGAASYDAFGGGVVAEPNYIESCFSTYLYTGNGSTQTITNGIDLSTKGGMVITKARSIAYGNILVDTTRGVNNVLQTSTTNPSYDIPTAVTGVSTTGFSVGSYSNTNGNGQTFASWTFRKQPKFFDVVTYTGNGSAPRNISHNLGSVPGCIMIKRTDSTGTWTVYHSGIGNTKALFLNATAAADTNSVYWNNTTPTSTVFTLGGTFGDINANGATYVAYLFAHDAGGFGLTGTDNVISCGSFTAAGPSSDVTVNLGYEPQWILMRAATAIDDWYIYDVMRGMSYTATAFLKANTSAAEGSFTSPYGPQPTATGFIAKNSLGWSSGEKIIYIAIRRGPMKTPTVGTSVFAPVYQAGGGTVTTNFRVDATITKDVTVSAVGDNFVWDRLRGSANGSLQAANLKTNSRDAESGGSFSAAVMNVATNAVTDSFYGSGYNISYLNFQRAPSFFDEVCYTGNGVSTRDINHNLGVTPELIIIKERSNSITNWYVYTAAMPAVNAIALFLQQSTTGNVPGTGGAAIWNLTSTTFRVSTSTMDINNNNVNFVAYMFATCPGVSKVGSYTGTGALQTINCGFTSGSRFVLIRRIDSAGAWYVWDSARGISSGNDPYFLWNTADAEVTGTNYIDTTSVGFQVTAAAPSAINANGGTFIFLAIA